MAKKLKIISPNKSLKGIEILYRKELFKLGKELVNAVRKDLLGFLKTQEQTYVTDGLASNLNTVFNNLNKQFSGVITASFANQTASKFVNELERRNGEKFDKKMMSATGINLGGVISAEGLDEFVGLNINNNVSLIKSLPEEYLKSVETIVANGVASGARYETIAKQIVARTGSTNSKLLNRIKTIARDQTQKINSQLNVRRSGALGIEEGIFRTSKDERVRKCHKELDRVQYKLSKGAWSKTCKKFIQPGITDINCRCNFSPVIEIEEPKIRPEKPIVQPIVQPKPKIKITPTPTLKPKVEKITVEQEKQKYKNLSEKTEKELKESIRFENVELTPYIEDYLQDFTVNTELREGKADMDYVKNLDKEINKTILKEDVTLYRGLIFDKKGFDKFLENAKVGTIQQDKGYFSTTIKDIDESVFGEDFSIKLEILADKNTKGVYLPSFKLDEDQQESIGETIEFEKEFLMPRDTKIQFLSKPTIKGKNATFVVKVVPEKIEKPVKKPTIIKPSDFKSLKNIDEKEYNKFIKFENKEVPEELHSYLEGLIKNNKLRKNIPFSSDPFILKKRQLEVKALDKLTRKKSLKQPLKLNRGLIFREKIDFDNFLETMIDGTIHKDKGFMSTTVGDIPPVFLPTKRQFGVKIELLADKKTKGTYVMGYKNVPREFRREKEFLLPRNTKYQVIGKPKKIDDNLVKITARIVNV